MTDGAAEFFEALARRGHEPLLEKATGTIRFEVANGRKTDGWLVAIERGDVSVSRRGISADSTLRAHKALFDGIASGKVNLLAAILRGELDVEGDLQLLIRFRRLFPGPPTRRRRGVATKRRR